MLSAVIITKNAARHIASCISSCVEVVDEIILIDAESTDGTVQQAIAASDKVEVHIRPWNGYGAARNYGALGASTDWILSIDADEWCSDELKASIANLELQDTSPYTIKRINIYKGKKISRGLLAPEQKMRIYNRAHHTWNDAQVHEQLVSIEAKSMAPRKISGSLMHHTYDDVTSHRAQLEHYARLAAQEWRKTDRRPSKFEAFFSPIYHFMRHYLWRGGILDLEYGLETSRTAAFYHAEKYRQYNLLSRTP